MILIDYILFSDIGESAVHLEKADDSTEGFRNVHDNITIKNSVFRFCKGIKGGGLYCDSYTIRLCNCMFDGNFALYGGDIYIVSPVRCSMNETSCVKSNAKVINAGITIDTSVIFSYSSQNIKSINCSELTSPSATAIDVWGGNPSVINSKVANCIASFRSSSLRTSSKSGTVASVFNSMFINNTCNAEGGAYNVYWFQSESNINGSYFLENKARNEMGNSVYSQNSQVKISISNSHFSRSKEKEIYLKAKSSSVSLKSGNSFGSK